MTAIGLESIPLLTATQREQLSARWIRSVQDLAGLLQIEVAANQLEQLLRLDSEGLRTLVLQTRAALGPVTMEATYRPHDVPALGLRLDRPSGTTLQTLGFEADRNAPRLSGLEEIGDLPDYCSLVARMQPVRDQGPRGTCVAFASVAAREYLLPQPVPLSEQFLYWLCKELDGGTGGGTWPLVAAFGLQRIGVCEALDWPYNPTPMPGHEGQGPAPQRAESAAWEYRIQSFLDLDEEHAPLPHVLMHLLHGFSWEGRHIQGRPVVIGLPVYESWRSAETYRTGRIYGRIANEPPLGGHAMCVVGYRLTPDVPGGGYFIVRNSWGADWAAQCPEASGHALISFRYIEEAAGVLLCGTALFEASELGSDYSEASDPSLSRRLREARQPCYEAAATEFLSLESLDERIEERTFREDASLELERLIERKAFRLVSGKQSLSLPLLPDASPALQRTMLLGALDEQVKSALADFAEARIEAAPFLESMAGWLPRKHWVRCYAFQANPATSDLMAEGKTSRRFKHLPIMEIELPPVPGVEEAFRSRIGLRCALPEAAFKLDEPPRLDRQSAPIAVSSWLSIPEDAQSSLGAQTRVGILDTGLDLSHPDFSGVVPSHCMDFTQEGRMSDEIGHGTHCLGILAGSGNGAPEYRGVAPLSQIYVARVFDRHGRASLEGILSALDWLAEQGVNVVSLSIGTSDSPNGQSQLTQICAHLANRLHMVICVSAGNEGPAPETITPPGDSREVCTIAAVDSYGNLAPFSSRGCPREGQPTSGKPNVAGPGVRVVGPRSSGAPLSSIDSAGRYTEMSGTSMAAPAIAGVCSLLWSACPTATALDRRRKVFEALLESVKSLQSEDGEPGSGCAEAGPGVPDVKEALRLVGWSPGAGSTSDSISTRTTDDCCPSRTRCSWKGIPFAAGWQPGADYFRCENPDCQSPETEQFVSMLAWQAFKTEAGGRRWCRNCLAIAYDLEAKNVELRGLEAPVQAAVARLEKNVRAMLPQGTMLGLDPGSGSSTKYGLAECSELVRTIVGEKPFFVPDQQAPAVSWLRLRMKPSKRSLVRNRQERSIIVGLLSGVDAAQAEAAITAASLREAWGDAAMAVIGVPVLLDRTPLTGQVDGRRWLLLPLPYDQGHWGVSSHWPSTLDPAFRGCFVLALPEERYQRCRDLILEHARKKFDGTSEVRLDFQKELQEAWNPEMLAEISGRFFGNCLKPICDARGNLVSIRLEQARSWIGAQRDPG